MRFTRVFRNLLAKKQVYCKTAGVLLWFLAEYCIRFPLNVKRVLVMIKQVCAIMVSRKMLSTFATFKHHS